MSVTLTSEVVKRQAHSAAMNLSKLQRTDPSIRDILHTAKHTVLYKLNQEQQWIKQDIEGPAFILHRATNSSSSSPYRLLILNRRAIDNYSIDITGDMKVEEKDQYLFYADGKGHVYNLWFYEPNDCHIAYTIFQNIIQSINNNTPLQINQATIQGTNGNAAVADGSAAKYTSVASPSASNTSTQTSSSWSNVTGTATKSATTITTTTGSGSQPLVQHEAARPPAPQPPSPRSQAPRLNIPASVPRNIEYQQAIDARAHIPSDQRALHQQLSSFLTKFQEADEQHLQQFKQQQQQRLQQQLRQPQTQSRSAVTTSSTLTTSDTQQSLPPPQATTQSQPTPASSSSSSSSSTSSASTSTSSKGGATADVNRLLQQMNIRTVARPNTQQQQPVPVNPVQHTAPREVNLHKHAGPTHIHVEQPAALTPLQQPSASDAQWQTRMPSSIHTANAERPAPIHPLPQNPLPLQPPISITPSVLSAGTAQSASTTTGVAAPTTPPGSVSGAGSSAKQLSMDQFRIVLSKLVADDKWLNHMYKKYVGHNYDLKALFK